MSFKFLSRTAAVIIAAIICNVQVTLGQEDSSSTEPVISSYTEPISYSIPTFAAVSENVSSQEATILNGKFTSYQVVSFNLTSLNAFLHSGNYINNFVMQFPNNQSFNLWLTPNDLRSSDYYSEFTTASGVTVEPFDSFKVINEFKGFIGPESEDNDNIVRLTISANGILGYIRIAQDNKILYIEPLSDLIGGAFDGRLVVYYPSDIISGSEIVCGSEELEIEAPALGGTFALKKHHTSCELLVLEIATEADYEFFNTYGSGSRDRILSLLNQIEGVYTRYLGIMFSVPFQHVWETVNDPYTTMDGGVRLEELRNHWNSTRTSIRRDVTHMWSGWGGGTLSYNGGRISGLAYTGYTCNNPSLSYSFSTQHSGSFKHVSSAAHELGHNLGGQHADAENCQTTIGSLMCSGGSATDEFYFNQNEINRITNYVHTNGTCLRSTYSSNWVGDAWEKTYSNNRRNKWIGSWHISPNDKMVAGDFDGNGHEELLLISNANNAYAMRLEFSCNKPADWVYKWSNMGNNTINSWYMTPGDKYYTGDFDGDGKADLLTISNSRSWVMLQSLINGNWVHKWSNNGNRRVGGWYVNSTDNFVVGDFNGDGKTELFCVAFSGWSMLVNFNNNTFQTMWHNSGNGSIGGFGANSAYRYIKGKYTARPKDELFAVAGNWATIIDYNSSTNNWDWGYSNYGASSVAGWTLPLGSTDVVLGGNIDNVDSKAELLFIQRGPNASYATTMDLNSSNQLQWNWSNYGNGKINDLTLGKYPYYYDQFLLIRANPNYQNQLITIHQSLGYANMYVNTQGSNFKQTGMEEEISSENSSLEFILYPSPNNGKFVIANSKKQNINCSVTVTDISGKTIFNREVNQQGQVEIDLTNNSAGVYLVKLKENNKIHNLKFIKY